MADPVTQQSSEAVAWSGVKVTVNETGKDILHGIAGLSKAGRILAIMGPTGSGKTTRSVPRA